MTYDLKLFIMEDEDYCYTRTGFYECIIPAIQAGLDDKQKVFVLWSKIAPYIAETGMSKGHILIDYASQYKVLSVTKSSYTEVELSSRKSYPVSDFDFFILDNWLGGGRNKDVSCRVVETLMGHGKGGKDIIVATKKDYPTDFSEFESITLISKRQFKEIMGTEISSLIRLSYYDSVFNKICLFNKSTFDFIPAVANNDLRMVSEPISIYNDIAFAKAYIECWDKIYKDRIECLISLRKNRRPPVYILSGTIDNKCDIETAKKNNIFFIAPPTEEKFNECLSKIPALDVNHNEPLIYAFEHGKILSPGAEDRIKKCLCLEKIDPNLEACIKQAAEKTKYWTISNECMQEVLSQCTINHWTPQMISIRQDEDWVTHWRNYLNDSKGKHSYKEIIKGLPDAQPYPGTKYAGYGVLLHLGSKFGGWKKLKDYLKDVSSGKITGAEESLLDELGYNKEKYDIFFLHGNQGFGQINSDPFKLQLDHGVDFIIVDSGEKKFLVPKGGTLEEIEDVSDRLDNDTKKKILDAARLKSIRSKSPQREKPLKKK